VGGAEGGSERETGGRRECRDNIGFEFVGVPVVKGRGRCLSRWDFITRPVIWDGVGGGGA
jgi:hypothetical protein